MPPSDAAPRLADVNLNLVVALDGFPIRRGFESPPKRGISVKRG